MPAWRAHVFRAVDNRAGVDAMSLRLRCADEARSESVAFASCAPRDYEIAPPPFNSSAFVAEHALPLICVAGIVAAIAAPTARPVAAIISGWAANMRPMDLAHRIERGEDALRAVAAHHRGGVSVTTFALLRSIAHGGRHVRRCFRHPDGESG